MSPQEQSYLVRVNRNIKFAPFLTAVVTAFTTMIGTSFVLGKKTAEIEARINSVEAESHEHKTQLTEVKVQLITNTADIRSLKDWRLEFKK